VTSCTRQAAPLQLHACPLLLLSSVHVGQPLLVNRRMSLPTVIASCYRTVGSFFNLCLPMPLELVGSYSGRSVWPSHVSKQVSNICCVLCLCCRFQQPGEPDAPAGPCRG
jgi:hypothetical protein